MDLLKLADQLDEISKQLRELSKECKTTKKKRRKKVKEAVKKAVGENTSTEVSIPDYSKSADFFTKNTTKKILEQMGQGSKENPTSFQKKLEEEDIESFNSKDLVHFFVHCSREQGIRYAVNWPRDTSHMKRLLEEFSPEEIVMMVEFLFYSEQDYLDKKKLSVGILTTGWLNTIYQDSLDWVEDKYVPESEKKKARNSDRQREWRDEDDADEIVGGLE